MDTLVIRNAKIEDYASIAEISRNDLGYDCSDKLVLSKLKGIDNSREAVFVAEQNREVCGYVHIEKYDVLYFETFGNVLGLAVKKEQQKKGIGKSLMKRAEDWAKSIDAKYIRLNSGFERKEAHCFYRNLGYNLEKNQIRFMKEI